MLYKTLKDLPFQGLLYKSLLRLRLSHLNNQFGFKIRTSVSFQLTDILIYSFRSFRIKSFSIFF